MQWHTLSSQQTLAELEVQPEKGLSAQEVQHRLAEYGANELEDKGVKSPWLILWEQLSEPLVLILIFAAALSGILGKLDSFIAITAIVILNAVLGLTQEYRAEKAMAALKQMAAPLVKVRRDGQPHDIAARDLVPGDVILLEAGNVIPADARLVQSFSLQAQEASLTGESYPVEKTLQVFENPDLGGTRGNVS